MNAKEFTIWLSGYLEASGKALNSEQTKTINDKLNSLFKNVTKAFPYNVATDAMVELDRRMNPPGTKREDIKYC